MDRTMGLLRIRVNRGINLVKRDSASSDPYVVVSCGDQRVKTKDVKDNCNPEWSEELTIFITDPDVPISLSVHDKDTFSGDDSMGNAQIDIKAFLECLKMDLQGLPDGTEVGKVLPNAENCLAADSCITCNNGKMTQDMILRLSGVECGKVEIQIEWIHVSSIEGHQN